IVVALAAPLLAPYDPLAQNLGNILARPGRAHWLGTDNVGRDVLSRVIWGTRVSLVAGFVSVAIPAVVGGVLGMLAGYARARAVRHRRRPDLRRRRDSRRPGPAPDALSTARGILPAMAIAADYARLEERILARDQVGASAALFGLIKDKRPVAEIVAQTVRIHAPYTHVPYHQRLD